MVNLKQNRGKCTRPRKTKTLTVIWKAKCPKLQQKRNMKHENYLCSSLPLHFSIQIKMEENQQNFCEFTTIYSPFLNRMQSCNKCLMMAVYLWASHGPWNYKLNDEISILLLLLLVLVEWHIYFIPTRLYRVRYEKIVIICFLV